jgi:nucleotide-binding universal stress UspA family protein
MTKRVLVAVDGTEASNTALEIACALADKYEANLGLLCVVKSDQVTDGMIKGATVEGVLIGSDFNSLYHSNIHAMGGTGIGEQEGQRAAYVSQISDAIADRIVAKAEAYSKDSAAKAIKTFVRSGDVAKEILNVAKSNDADVIIMGHDQQGRLESLIKGSVAEKVVRDSTCPCLVYCHPKQG